MTDKHKLTDQQLDQRVRDRLIASGEIKPEEIEAYRAGLPDLEAQAETVPYDQPALGGASRHQNMVELPVDDDDDDDDDNEGLE